jgi:hypothetical protein
LIGGKCERNVEPHFHARHEGSRAAFTFDGGLMEGEFSAHGQRLVREWAAEHAAELHENWALAQQHLPLKRIQPLS